MAPTPKKALPGLGRAEDWRFNILLNKTPEINIAKGLGCGGTLVLPFQGILEVRLLR
jgi:hypothetical protein